jgi:ubiquinone/menaquinone biosynthesis C-methylase UbiE
VKKVYSSYPLYNFLRLINEHPGEKKILDCGAGGLFPKLGLFAEQGFECYGIEIDEKRLDNAKTFAEKGNLKFELSHGDMRDLPYENEFFDAVFSWNSIFHLPKEEIYKSIQECIRVLKSGGWLFINLLSVDDEMYGEGEKQGEGEYFSKEEGSIHSFFNDEEADPHFGSLLLEQKTKRLSKRKIDENYQITCYIDYIYRKS